MKEIAQLDTEKSRLQRPQLEEAGDVGLTTGHDAEADVLTQTALDVGPFDKSLDRFKRLRRRPHLLSDVGNANCLIKSRRVRGPKLAQADALALELGQTLPPVG